MAVLYDQGGVALTDQAGLTLYDQLGADIAPVEASPMARMYGIDLCVGWSRIGECIAGDFDGVIRNLAAGEWRLTGSVDALEFEPGFALTDVDTIRVVRDVTIVYPGYVSPIAAGGVGGLDIVETADGHQFTLSGQDAWSVLASRLAYPTPSTGEPWADSHDVRSGQASTQAAAYIMANAGLLATADRQIPGLTVADDLVGLSGSWSARLQSLDQLVARICNDGGITCRLTVGFNGSVRVALTSAVDRSQTVILADQGDLINIQRIHTPASTTFVIAGGQGNLTARTFASSGTATGSARREVFSDQSSLAGSTEVQQSADTTLALATSTLTVRAEVTDAAALRLTYLDQYNVGDTVTAEIDQIRYHVVVESVQVHVGADRAVIRPALGDAAPNLVTGLIRDVAGLASRLNNQIA